MPTDPKDAPAILLCGRQVRDYKLCGHPIPTGFQIVECRRCRSRCALSPEAQKMMALPQALVLCSHCLEIFGAEYQGIVEVQMTEATKNAIATRPEARATFERLKKVLNLK